MDNGLTAKRLATRLRDRECWRLRVEEGLTQAEIAERVGLPQSNVSRALRRAGHEVAQEFAEDARILLAAHTERLERTYREAMLAWAKSREDVLTETEEDAGGTLKTVKSRRTQHGDAAHLNVGMTALRDIRKLWGLDDPETVRALLRQAEDNDDGDE